MDAVTLVAIADRVGIVAFAISGVAVGRRAGMDLFGLATLGLVAAIGGGILRDVLIGDVPRAIANTDYLLYAAGSSAAAIAFGAAGGRLPLAVLDAADAIGTGAFAATGALLATQAGLDWPAAILLAILTATGGGVLRDMLATRLPHVLQAELNATGSALGGGFAFLLRADPTAAVVAGSLVAATISMVGHRGWMRLPRLAGESDGRHR
ncbi:MAG: trimeric intracellular cation channel family protein [Dehalococcoidia bacterium]|nr:MAG: trimeric intracellular cation channel family protein [Dehalococcoidia bacterium]